MRLLAQRAGSELAFELRPDLIVQLPQREPAGDRFGARAAAHDGHGAIAAVHARVRVPVEERSGLAAGPGALDRHGTVLPRSRDDRAENRLGVEFEEPLPYVGR